MGRENGLGSGFFVVDMLEDEEIQVQARERRQLFFFSTHPVMA